MIGPSAIKPIPGASPRAPDLLDIFKLFMNNPSGSQMPTQAERDAGFTHPRMVPGPDLNNGMPPVMIPVSSFQDDIMGLLKNPALFGKDTENPLAGGQGSITDFFNSLGRGDAPK